jgi:hypothetical protein
VQDDFEDRNAAEWTHIAGSTIAVVSNGSSFVYRQSGLAAAAGSVRTGVDMKNQAIDADAVPRQFATGDRWFGLTVRQTDPNNYYYLTVRSTNAVSLRSLDNGVIRTLATAPLPVVLNQAYKLRLEAIGSRIRGYVDGRLVVEARDKAHTHGAPGLRMSKAAADYDNVVISPNPRLAVFKDDFESGVDNIPQWFSHAAPYQGAWIRVTDGTTVFQQYSVASGARVTTGVDADDQIVQARVKATQYAAGTGDRWFGVLARMRDDNNTYYVTLRNNNTVSLRKLVNGAIVTLDEAPLTVTLGTWYTLRLEAIGTSLRTYVNGRLLLEANDSTHTKGTYGLATSKTAARFDDVVVSQP